MKNTFRRPLRLSLGLILLLFPLLPCAQPSSVCQIQEFSTTKGVAQRNVSNIMQDSLSFIWFATWNGLGKFDGNEFRKFGLPPGEEEVTPGSRFLGCHPGKAWQIWCRTDNRRAYLFDTRREIFTDMLRPLERRDSCLYTVQRIFAFPNGVAWVVCQESLFRFSPSLEVTEYSPALGNLPELSVLNIKQDAEGNEWVFTRRGTIVVGARQMPEKEITFCDLAEDDTLLWLISRQGHLATCDKRSGRLDFVDLALPHGGFQWIYRPGKEEMYIGSGRSVIVYHPANGEIQHLDFSHLCPDIHQIYKDAYGHLWIFSRSQPGVIHHDTDSGRTRLLQTPPQDIPSSELHSDNLIFEDEQGTLWMVPVKGGFCYYDRTSGQLKPLLRQPDDPASAYTPVMYSPYYDGNNNLWFTDRRQLCKISFYPNAARFHPMDSGHETRAFLSDRDGRLWVASKKGYVRIYHPDGSLKGYLTPDGRITPSPALFRGNVYCFMQDRDGRLWLGTKKDGLACLEPTAPDTYRVTIYRNDPTDPHSLSNNSVYSICQDNRGRIWVGTHGGGINLIRPKDGGGVRFLHAGNTPGMPGESYAKIRTIREIDRYLFFGSRNGLILCETDFPDDGLPTFRINRHRPDDASSLNGNDVMDIYRDSSGEIYVLTFSGGINRLDSEAPYGDRLAFSHYTEATGLPSDLVYAMMEDCKGDLWVVAENALSRFLPRENRFEDFQKKHLARETYFSEATPVLWNGRLIVGTDGGYMEIDPQALQTSKQVPLPVLTSLWIHGVKQPLAPAELHTLTLAPSQRNISLRFVTPCHADPQNIRYSYRLKGLEDNWSKPATTREARYTNLPPGEYEFQVKSTNSDGTWGDIPRTLTVRVTPTFWETPWSFLVYALLFVLLTAVTVYILFTIYRLRHRIGLEKQLADIKLRFFTDVSHELRTPLTLISSPVAEVLEHEPISPQARRHLQLVHNNTRRMLQLVNQILDFRKIENRKMKLLLESTEVIGLLRQVMDNFSLLAEEKQITFTLRTDHDRLQAWTDRDKLQKILHNLIANAFKYTPSGKSITLCVQADEETLGITVEDQGKGIASDKLPLLFQRFETLVGDNILQPSSGIGLSLVKELVKLLKGDIQVESTPGTGSRFIVTLPVDKDAYADVDYKEFILDDGVASSSAADTSSPTSMSEHPADATSTADGTTEEKLSILVVEDNTELRRFLHDILHDTYRVLEASDGREGLELAMHSLPDFIISDIMMPVMDGLDMVRAIKENRDICHIPVILLSAKSSLDDRINGLEQGVDDYITKPFSSTYLKTRIRLLLQQRHQLQQRYMEQYVSTGREDGATSDTPPADTQAINPLDEQFMQNVRQIVEQHLNDSDFSIERFAREAGMGRTVFYQKIKNITGFAPIDFLQAIRIHKAAQLLDSGTCNVSDAAYMTGFNDPKYFSRCFKKHLDVSPSEYLRRKKNC